MGRIGHGHLDLGRADQRDLPNQRRQRIRCLGGRIRGQRVAERWRDSLSFPGIAPVFFCREFNPPGALQPWPFCSVFRCAIFPPLRLRLLCQEMLVGQPTATSWTPPRSLAPSPLSAFTSLSPSLYATLIAPPPPPSDHTHSPAICQDEAGSLGWHRVHLVRGRRLWEVWARAEASQGRGARLVRTRAL